MKDICGEQPVIAAVADCLADTSFTVTQRSESALGAPCPDLALNVGLPDRQQLLLIEAKSSGQPRIARAAINQLLVWKSRIPDAYGVFVAPYITPRTAEMCRQAGVGCIDLAGNCRLDFANVYIQKQGNPNKFARKRDLRSLYSPKAGRVLRLMLAAPGRRWKIANLAREAGVSLGQTFNVKQRLADREWIRLDADGFYLADPEALLADWATYYDPRRHTVREFYSLEPLARIEALLGRTCGQAGITYALAGLSAAARIAPAVRYQRATAYVGASVEFLAKELALRQVSSGANVALISPYDEGVFYGSWEVEGLTITSPIQTYLDLIQLRGRGEEAAAALLDEVIKPQW